MNDNDIDTDFFSDFITIENNFNSYINYEIEKINQNSCKYNKIKELKYLLLNRYIPKNLYPISLQVKLIENMHKHNEIVNNYGIIDDINDIDDIYDIDDELDYQYINLISDYLYKNYIFRKISGIYKKSYKSINDDIYYNNTHSKLRICTYANNINNYKIFL